MPRYEEFNNIKGEKDGHQYEELQMSKQNNEYASIAEIKTKHLTPDVTAVKESCVPNRRYCAIFGIVVVIVVLLVIITALLVVFIKGSGFHPPTPTAPTGTSPSSTEETIYSTTFSPGVWDAWTEWSGCSTSCGRGTQTRSRNCPAGSCSGLDAVSRYCLAQSCNEANEYGKWTTWSSWSSCGQTCGSSIQSRNRNCTRITGQRDCIGSNTNDRTCNNGACPDCSKTCGSGESLDTDCFSCICSGATGTGRVLTESGAPIQDVEIAYEEIDHLTLATTSDAGFYTLNNICSGSSLVFKREGFISVTIQYQTPMEDVILPPLDRLTIRYELRENARLSGGCITLNCDAVGVPVPDYYEWFKNGILLEAISFAKLNYLQISEVNVEDSGTYRCRASNDFSSVASQEVLIDIQGNPEDFCNPSPMSLFKVLPSGCFLNGENNIDVGRCPQKPCSFGKESCDEDARSSCGVTEFQTITIECSSANVQVSVARRCGCVSSIKTQYDIRGLVVSAKDNTAVGYVNVYINGTEVASTNGGGNFNIRGETEVQRLVLKVKDPWNLYADQVMIVNINERSTREEYITIKMQTHSPATVFKSDEEFIMDMGDTGETGSFAQIMIPPNNLFTESGNPYNGDAKAVIDIIDTRQASEITAAPGDFSAVSAEGEDVKLVSTGMFRMSFSDTDGNPLNVAGKVNVSFNSPMVDSRSIQNKSPTKLWKLSTNSGKWEEMSEMALTGVSDIKRNCKRCKRQQPFSGYSAELDGITIDRHWLNLDTEWERDITCHSKIRVYEDNSFSSPILTHSNLFVVLTNNDNPMNPGNTLSYQRASTDNWGDYSNGYCIMHPCDTYRTEHFNHRGYIIGDHGSIPLQPSTNASDFDPSLNYSISDNAINVNFNLKISENGPFYDHDGYFDGTYSTSCSNADTSEPHFQFFKDEVSTKCQPSSINNVDVPNNWFSWKPQIGQDYYGFVKVMVDGPDDTNVRTVSFVGRNDNNMATVPMQVGEQFGVRDGCTENKVVCLEVKVSSKVFNQMPPVYEGVYASFNISVIDDSNDYEIEVKSNILTSYGDAVTVYADGTVSMLLPPETTSKFNKDFGIYYDSDVIGAEYACRRGKDDASRGQPQPEMTQDNAAFTFILKP